MRYRWDGFSLDHEAMLLVHNGQQVDVTRKTLACIHHLVENRHRVVGYDELIRTLWRHDNVTNQQLSQVILSARRALGDDGQAQRLIRTAPGLGYRWVGAISEATAAETAQQAALPKSPSPRPTATPPIVGMEITASPAPLPLPSLKSSRARPRWLAAGLLSFAIGGCIAWRSVSPDPTETVAFSNKRGASATHAPLTHLEDLLWSGEFDALRDGLATLPPHLVDTPDARMLEVRLDIERGRFDRAAQKMAVLQARNEVQSDLVLKARLLTLESIMHSRGGSAATDAIEPAEQAIALLQSIGDKAPKQALGEALRARGSGLLNENRHESAVRDLLSSRDILLETGHEPLIAASRRQLAQAWLRMGRLAEALAELDKVASICQRIGDPVNEAMARNTATRLHIELIQWDEALAESRRSMIVSKRIPDPLRRAAASRLHALVLTYQGRLREAEFLLEDTDNASASPLPTIASTVFQLTSGKPDTAEIMATRLYDQFTRYDDMNLILQNREGSVLLWTMAARELRSLGRPMPSPSRKQLEIIDRPESVPGRVARGNWLILNGNPVEAEKEFRIAVEESMKRGRLLQVIFAADPLIELLLRKNDTHAAKAVLADLRGLNPERMDRDYRVNLLRLRVALASRDVEAAKVAYQRAVSLTGERTLPNELVMSYGQLTAYVAKPKNTVDFSSSH